MARSFSLALNDLFKIDNSLADLDAAVSEKYLPTIISIFSSPFSSLAQVAPMLIIMGNRKHKVSSQTSELEALEARLKATEERLKAASSSSPSAARSGRSSPHQRASINSSTFSQTSGTERAVRSPLSESFGESDSGIEGRTRPLTGRSEKGQIPGAPPTPGASEGEEADGELEKEREYVVVTRADTVKDGDESKQ